MTDNTPNPGSDEAIDAGCTCPVMDNAHGTGVLRGTDWRAVFYINGECPLHGSGIAATVFETREMEVKDGK